MKREFTGVFIPAHIWTSNLLPAEKMLLGEIAALSQKNGWCDASRAHFAEWLHCSAPNVSYFIQKLEAAGYLEVCRTPGYRSRLRVKTEAFWVGDVNKVYTGVVNGIDGGSKPHLPGVVNGIDGGSKWGLPEIKDKYNNKRKEESENAPAPFALEAKPFDFNSSAAAPAAPNWSELPNANTPRELREHLTRFYTTYPHELEGIREATVLQNDEARVWPVIEDFCTWAVSEGWNRRSIQQIHARLGGWFRQQKRFDTINTTNSKPAPAAAALQIRNPETKVRFAK